MTLESNLYLYSSVSHFAEFQKTPVANKAPVLSTGVTSPTQPAKYVPVHKIDHNKYAAMN